MDYQADNNSDFNLPRPAPSSDGQPGGYEFTPNKTEAPSSSDSRLPMPDLPPIAAPVSHSAAAAPSAQTVATDDSAAQQNTPQRQVQPADDPAAGDALDKEWVNKARTIVEQTKNDPYAQSNELGKVKAEYLRIRYNKHVKVVQDKTP